MMEKVEADYKVIKKDPPKFLRSEIVIGQQVNPYGSRILITKNNIYENPSDNNIESLGHFFYKDRLELDMILTELMKFTVTTSLK